jgi:hypothetical protein
MHLQRQELRVSSLAAPDSRLNRLKGKVKLMRHIVLCCVVLFGLVGSAEEAQAGGIPMVFGGWDFLAPIQDVETSQGRVSLAYRYEATCFVLPLWLSNKGYVLVESDGEHYTPLGDTVDLELESMLGTSRPAVPMSATKFFAHICGYLGWLALAGLLWRWTNPAQPESADGHYEHEHTYAYESAAR